MTILEHDRSFFEELEAAAKGLSVASDSNKTTELRELFENLKSSLKERSEPRAGVFDKGDGTLSYGRAHHA